MKLIGKIPIPDSVGTHMKSLVKDSEPGQLAQLLPDVWYCNGDVEKHTDNTETGKDSIFCVLDSKGIYTFTNDSQASIEIPIGTIVRHDGRIPHSAKSSDKGYLIVLIWDIPIEMPVDEPDIFFMNEIIKRVEELK